MTIEKKRIESTVNATVGRSLTWAIYGLLVGAKSAVRRLASCAAWLRRKYAD